LGTVVEAGIGKNAARMRDLRFLHNRPLG
jgi:hypothetical protein